MSLSRLNLALIAGLLLGYMFLDRGFAYVGFGSIFVGEVVLVIAMLLTLITSVHPRCLANPIGYALLAFLFWSVCILIFNTSGSWKDALRDSVIWGYGLYALVVASLLLRTRSIETSLIWYGRWIPWFAVWAAPMFVLQLQLRGFVPNAPGGSVSLLYLKAGDFAVHLAGALAFLMLGLHRVYWKNTVKWFLFKEIFCYSGVLLGIIATGSRNRGGLVSVLLAIAVVTLFRPNNRFTRFLFPAVIVMLLLSAFDVSIPTGGGREISLNQIADNIQSVFIKSDEGLLSGTVEWRLKWWNGIVRDTVYGDSFWHGSGFGNSLADRYGFDDGTTNRSPHNGHLTILAREGVPGFILWLILIQTVYGTLTRSYFTAVSANQVTAANVDLWIMAYLTAFLANMSFDVYLEGPQGGIWFWCIVGFAIAVTHTQRATATARANGGVARVDVASRSPGVMSRK
jgi:hypothetical protein